MNSEFGALHFLAGNGGEYVTSASISLKEGEANPTCPGFPTVSHYDINVNVLLRLIKKGKEGGRRKMFKKKFIAPLNLDFFSVLVSYSDILKQCQ